MSITFSGCRSRSAGVISAISKQVKLVDLKPLTKITVTFDPFHEKVAETRDFLLYISSRKIANTNIECNLRTKIVCNRADPTVVCDYENGNKLVMKSAELTSLEMLKIFNKYVSSTVEKGEEEPVAVTKKMKKK